MKKYKLKDSKEKYSIYENKVEKIDNLKNVINLRKNSNKEKSNNKDHNKDNFKDDQIKEHSH